MNKYILPKAVLLLAGMLLMLQGAAFADVYAAKAGVKTATAYDSNGSTALSTGDYIQYIWLKPGGGTDIYGPTDGSGNVNSTYEEVRPEVFPGLGGCNLVGYDTASGAQSALGDGHFYHQVSIEASSQQRFVCRVWNAASPAAATHYGETVVFASNASALNPPSENDLASMATLFDKNVPPAATPASAETTRRGQGATAPQITVWCSRKIGSRYFQFELYRDAGYSTQYGGTVTQYYDTSYHYAATTDGSQDQSTVFTLTTTDDAKTFYWRARAGNSFGNGSWTTGAVYVPENLDPTVPMAVTDLVATLEGTSLILSWTAPYDTDKYGALADCTAYDIRVSSEAILNLPVDPFTSESTNPNLETTWDSAQSISSFFASSPVIPTPGSWSTGDNVTITSVPDGTYFFGVKGQDASGNWSYVSNVAGLRVGSGGGGGAEDKTYTFTREAGGLGINTFVIPYSIPLNTPAISNLLELIQNINSQAGTNVVYTLGWWDPTTMQPAGYEIKYNVSGTLNQIDEITGTSGLGYPSAMPIVKDRAYQIYVIDNATFTIRGQR